MLNIAKVEALIKENGWSNSYFCCLFGKSRGWIRDWKRGAGLPDENALKAIADRLDTTVEYLTDQTDEKGKKNKPAANSDELDPQDKQIMDLIESLTPENKRLAFAQIEAILKIQDSK